MDKHPGSRLIRNSVFNLFNTFFLMVTTWAISIWIARQLGPSDYGIFNLVLWLVGTFSWVVGMGLIHAVTKFIAEHDGKKDRKAVSAIVFFVMKIELALSAVVTIILIIFHLPIADYFFTPNESFFFFLSALGLIPGVVTAIFSAAIEGIQKFEYFTYSSVLITPFSFGAKIVVLLMGKGINGLLVVMLIFSFVNVIFYWIVLHKEGLISAGWTSRIGTDLRRRIGKYNSSVMAILLCDKIVWDKSENFFLGRLCLASEIGFYNLGYNVAKNFMTILPNTFWRVLFPAMSSYFGTGDRNKMKRLYFVTTRYLAFISFPVGVAGALLAYQILHYLYGHDFVGAQRVLQIIFLCSILSSMNEPGSAILYGFEKQNFILKYGLILAAVNILLDILLIKHYGAIGAAVCYAITTTLASIGGLIYTCTTMKLKYPIVSVFKVLFATIIMGTVMEVILLHNQEIIGSLLALCAGSFAYLVSALILGTFEEEDYELMRSAIQVMPPGLQNVMKTGLRFIQSFKQEYFVR
jgi:stage V sporulation protein B